MKYLYRQFFTVFFIFFFLGNFSGFFVLAETTAPSPSSSSTCSSENGGTCSSEGAGFSQKDTTIILREPIIPGKNTIDVSVSQGSFGIISQYSKMIYQYIITLGSIVGVLSIMFSGIQMMISVGESGSLEESKKAIFTTFKALLVLYLSGVILYIINPTFFSFQ